MKLSDIFSLNLNSKGGVKLYRKIMGKYNIPKQDSKQLVKEIRNSSEGVGNSKIKYYKCLTNSSKCVVGEIGIYLSYIKCYEYDDNANITNFRFGTKASLETLNKQMVTDAFAFLPIEINEGNTIMTFNSFEEFINILSGENHFKDNFKSITEEEFYKVD